MSYKCNTVRYIQFMHQKDLNQHCNNLLRYQLEAIQLKI